MRGGERENFGQDVKTKKLENNKINKYLKIQCVS